MQNREQKGIHELWKWVKQAKIGEGLGKDHLNKPGLER